MAETYVLADLPLNAITVIIQLLAYPLRTIYQMINFLNCKPLGARGAVMADIVGEAR